MCGRFVLATPEDEIIEYFGIDQVHRSLEASYNIAPGQQIPVVLARQEKKHLGTLQWGLIPHWTRDLKKAPKPINARGESAHEKASFRQAFARRRCLIPANGFYEWEKGAKGKNKTPYYVKLQSQPLFAMAGLWDRWTSPEGEEHNTCTIVTTEANSTIHHIHPRMPLILAPEHYQAWLDTNNYQAPELKDIIQPYPAEEVEVYEVSPKVNRVACNDPSCIEAAPELPPTGNLSLF